jgi:hypothetical protein
MSFYGPTPEWNGLVDLADFAADDDYLVIQFDDGSECKFFYAFYRREGDRLVVYTEHCGYQNETYKDRQKRREAN